MIGQVRDDHGRIITVRIADPDLISGTSETDHRRRGCRSGEVIELDEYRGRFYDLPAV